MDKMADANCSILKMSADGVDEIDKMRDARWKRADETESADEMGYGGSDGNSEMEKSCQPLSMGARAAPEAVTLIALLILEHQQGIAWQQPAAKG